MVDTPVPLPALQRTGVNQRSPAHAKIALFRSLFHGREDVYPRRFESRKTGRACYSPGRRAAEKLIRAVILSEAKNLALSIFKSRIKRSDCPHQRFLPITDEVIRWHLSGQDDEGRGFVMGVYPMLLDETCFFLAGDLHKASRQVEAAGWLAAGALGGSFLDACRH